MGVPFFFLRPSSFFFNCWAHSPITPSVRPTFFFKRQSTSFLFNGRFFICFCFLSRIKSKVLVNVKTFFSNILYFLRVEKWFHAQQVGANLALALYTFLLLFKVFFVFVAHLSPFFFVTHPSPGYSWHGVFIPKKNHSFLSVIDVICESHHKM